MSWSNVLIVHRAAENYHGVALMVRDPILMRLAAAWPKVRRQLPDPPPPGTAVDLEAVWQKTRIDFQGWGGLAQASPLLVMEGWTVLMGNGVILPDGTLNHLADSIIKKEAAGTIFAEFGVKPGELKK